MWHQATATDLLFITLRKSEALFSPTTRYRDRAAQPRWRLNRTVRVPGLCALREPRRGADLVGSRVAIRWQLERKIPVGWMPGCSSPSLGLAV